MTTEPALPPWPWFDGNPLGEIIRRREDAAVGLYCIVHTQRRRVYRKDANGRSTGGVLPRYSFEPRKILGETRSSWLVGLSEWDEEKFPKRPDERRPRKFYGIEEVEDIIWKGENLHRLTEHIRRIKDAELLRKIAQLSGYVSENCS